jgi:RNA recognition motif-containing protein
MNMPSINTGAAQMQENGISSPGTGYDMNFTPLLPSQLLLGSPFQPGTPNAFASPQFPMHGGFAQQTPTSANPLSPTFGALGASGLGSPTGFGSQYATYYQQQSPTVGSPLTPGIVPGTSRTVYLGNIPPETSAEEILSHVRSGQIESVRLLPDKNCAFISFLDSSSATHFHSDAILKKLAIRGQDIKVGWGKPSQVPTSVAIAVQQSGASRNVYLGNLPEDVTEDELREDLGKFGPIDTVKIVREKAIGFVHFLSIGNAIKAVNQLPQEPKWQTPRRVYYGKDRCAYVSKTQQQNAAQYLGIAPGYAHLLNSADKEMISTALAQQSAAAAAVATSAGGINNLGNRTVYLGNIHPETTIEEICNVVRGGLLHHIRYIPDKHICFVTFIDPTAAASFYALSNIQGLMIHNRRLKVGWGKHSGALPPAIALAVSGGASRNVYIGNLDETWTEDRLRQDFSEYGEIELVNTLREKSCAFVNFTNIANAIKAIEAVRSREEYKRFKINFGKDRCGNPPRQTTNGTHQAGTPTSAGHPSSSPVNGQSGLQPSLSHSGSGGSPAQLSPAGLHSSHSPGFGTPTTPGMNGLHPAANPLQVYLAQQQQQQEAAAYASNLQQQLAAQAAAVYGQNSSSQFDPVGQAANSAVDGLGHSNGNGIGMNQNLRVGGQHSRALSMPAISHQSHNGLGMNGYGGMMGWAEEDGMH